MIAEYERAKIVERGRRGRLFRARQGSVNALGRAPFGYVYRPKADGEPASFQVVLHEAKVVRRVFEALVREHKSIEGHCARAQCRWCRLRARRQALASFPP
jgi:site-specific DNA recombinase